MFLKGYPLEAKTASILLTKIEFFCSSLHFYVLLSPYLCFISFLYLDLYSDELYFVTIKNTQSISVPSFVDFHSLQ